MDIKAISSTNASVNMNSQNIDALNKDQIQKVQQQDQNKQIQNNQQEISPEVLKQALEDLNKKLDMLNSQLKVETDDETGIRVIKIVDKETNEVIRQIPPEVMLKIAKYMDEIAGLLFNEKV
ncbi:MAG: flagellar protein FlaG [Aquificae bacterium]|nr:flagellar protein FlaG [Aquificota bacterium]